MSTATPVDGIRSIAGLEILGEWDRDLIGSNPLSFPGYDGAADRGADAVLTGEASVGGQRVAYIESDFSVHGGSMGVVVGEKVCRAFDRAAVDRLPVVASVRTGGARMQEGMLSLVQMPRVVAALRRHSAAGLLSLGCLRSPTSGGVYASWASLIDLRAAETGATVGFAGPRVVEAMTGTRPPASSHTAESAFAAGSVDAVLSAVEVEHWVTVALGAASAPLVLPPHRPSVVSPARHDRAGGRMALARRSDRASGAEWAAALCDSWTEIKGSDPTIVAGLATVAGVRCVVVAMDRHAHGDAAARPGPAAYRLAHRAIRLATKLSLPVLTLVDTPGADPSPASEADGVARDIARTLLLLDEVPTPTVSLCVGEGGSGGAIALAHTDRVFLLGDAIFSVIGPEAAAVILWRDATRSEEAAEALRIDSASAVRLGVADAVLDDPLDRSGVEAVRERVARELLDAVPGDRHRRTDAATSRWLTDL